MLTAARLRDGVTLAQVRAEMDVQSRRLAREYPDTNADRSAGVVLLSERQGEFSKPFLTLLQATALFVLLIACANLANLQLAQTVARRREIAVRAALGAGRWRVVRLLLIENVVLALAGGAAAVAAAYSGIELLKASMPADTTRLIMGWSHVALRAPVLEFTLALAIAAGITFGLLVALRASRLDVAGSLKDGSQQGGSRSRMRPALVMGEVMLAVIAVIGASQMVRGFQAMFDLYQGFSPNGILAMRLVLPADSYDTPHKVATFFDSALESVLALPGVESASVSTNLPGALRFNSIRGIQIEGKPTLSRAQRPSVDLQFVGSGYFRLLKIPVRGGRAVSYQDGAATSLVAVINERLAARYWPGENPVGQRIRLEGEGQNAWRTIVGIVADVHQFWFQQESDEPVRFLVVSQPPGHGDGVTEEKKS